MASVRENTTGSNMSSIDDRQPGRLRATNMSLRELLRYAYGLPREHAIEGPPQLDKRFDIEARAAEDSPQAGGRDATPRLLRGLLTDRFKLQSHTETRSAPVVVLSLAHSDGRLGPKLLRSTTDCVAFRESLVGKPPNLDPLAMPVCSYRNRYDATRQVDGLRFDSLPLDRFLELLRFFYKKPVIDRTGLTGNFSFELIFSQSQTTADLGPSIEPSTPDGLPRLPDALEQQLGLKVTEATGPVDVMVVDRVDELIPN